MYVDWSLYKFGSERESLKLFKEMLILTCGEKHKKNNGLLRNGDG